MFDRATIVDALGRLAELLREQNTEGEVCLLGGTVMLLAFDARPTTKDVDAIFRPASLIRELASQVARERDLPPDWLNDGAKGFVSARHDVEAGDLPQFPGLRVVAPTPEYMLALKCMASRITSAPGGADDVADITFLVRHLALGTVAEALDIVTRYYPANRVPPRAAYLLEEVFAALGEGPA